MFRRREILLTVKPKIFPTQVNDALEVFFQTVECHFVIEGKCANQDESGSGAYQQVSSYSGLVFGYLDFT